MTSLTVIVGLVCLAGCQGIHIPDSIGGLRRKLTGEPDTIPHYGEAEFFAEEVKEWNTSFLGKRNRPDYDLRGFQDLDSGMLPYHLSTSQTLANGISGGPLHPREGEATWNKLQSRAKPGEADVVQVPDAAVDISTGDVGIHFVQSHEGRSHQGHLKKQLTWEGFKQLLLADEHVDIPNGDEKVKSAISPEHAMQIRPAASPDISELTIQELQDLIFNGDSFISTPTMTGGGSDQAIPHVASKFDLGFTEHDERRGEQSERNNEDSASQETAEIPEGPYKILESTIELCDIVGVTEQLQRVTVPSRTKQTQALLRKALKSCSQESAGALIILLMEHGVFPDAGGRDPLALFAVESENRKLLSMIIQAGGKLDAVKTGHTNPLRKALMKGDKHIVRQLLEAGVRTDKVFSGELRERLEKFISEYRSEYTFNKRPEWLEKLVLEHSSDKSQETRELLEIIKRGDEEDFENYLKCIKLTPRDGQTRTLVLHALEKSRSMGSYKMLTSLFRHGASGMYRIKQIPMVQIALDVEDIDLLNAVLDAKGNPNIVLKRKTKNPIDFAIQKNNYRLVEALLNHGAELSRVERVQELKEHASDLDISEDIITKIESL